MLYEVLFIHPCSSGSTWRHHVRVLAIRLGVSVQRRVRRHGLPARLSLTLKHRICRYGFVNFRTLNHLEAFARHRLGQKWGLYMSDKVLQVRSSLDRFTNAIADTTISSRCHTPRFSEPRSVRTWPSPLLTFTVAA